MGTRLPKESLCVRSNGRHLQLLPKHDLCEGRKRQRKEITIVALGKIKWFSDAKGYGFIDTGEGKDLFVHYSAIQQDGYKSLREGQEVEYEVGQGPKGPQAEQVVPRA